MRVSAKDLYRELKAFGWLPRTFTLNCIVIQTDTLTGKTHEKSDGINKHALVMIEAEGKSVTVDFDMLRDFTKKVGLEMREVRVVKQLNLKMYDDNFMLFHIQGTPGAELDVNTMVEPVTIAKV